MKSTLKYFILLALILWMVTTPIAAADTYQVSTGSDDGYDINGSSTFSTGSPLYVGGKNASGSVITTGLRFTNIAIPKGSSITSAKLDFNENYGNTYGTYVKTKIYGDDQDDCAAFGTGNLPRSRTKTTAAIDWDSNGSQGSAGQWYQTSATVKPPEMNTIVQEIIDRAGWASGNDMCIIITDDGSTNDWWMETRSYEYTGNISGPKLVITYVAPTPTPTPTPYPPALNDFSLSTWVNPTTSIASKAIMVLDNEIRLVTNASSQPLCQFHNGSSWQAAATSSVALTIDAWQHVACVYETNQLRLFVNGNLVGSTNLPNTNLNDTNNKWRFGSDSGGTYGDFSGTIDEYRLYNRALTPSEISQLYNWSPGPVAYYPMDEGQGTATIFDRSGNGNNLTMSNVISGSWVVGKIGGGFKFDGRNDYLSKSYDSDFDFGTGGFTIDGWFKKPEVTTNSSCSPQTLTNGVLNFGGFEGGNETLTNTGGGIDAYRWVGTDATLTMSTIQNTTKRSGEFALDFNDMGGSFDTEYMEIRKPDRTYFNTPITWLTFYFRPVDQPTTGTRYTIADIQGDCAIHLSWSGGSWNLCLDDSATCTGAQAVTQNQWNKIEMKIDATAGLTSLYINDGNATTKACSTGTTDYVELGGAMYQGQGQFDDWVVSTSELNFNPQVVRMDVDGNGNSTTWTNDYQNVDEIPHDTDTTYIGSSTATDQELNTLETAASAGVVGYIKGVKNQVLVRDEGGTSNLASVIRTNNTDYDNGEDVDPGAAYQSVGKVFENNPGTNSVWNSDELNDLQIGVLNNASVASRTTAMSAMVLTDGAGDLSTPCYMVARYDNDQGFKLWTDTVGHLTFGIDDDGLFNPDDAATTSAEVDDNTWHFFSAQKSATAIYLYLDGRLAASDTNLAATNTLTSDSAPLTFGSDEPSNGFYWDGTLDDVRIYNYSRNPTQQKIDMNAGHPIPGSPVGSAVAYWKFDEGGGLTAYDSSLNGQHATLQSANPFWTLQGKYLKALDFESTNSDFLSTADSAALSITTDLTLSAWIKPESITATTLFPIAGKWDSSYKDYLLAQYGDEIRFYLGSASNYITTSATNLQTGTWYHVLATYQASSQTAVIYVNALPQSSVLTGTLPASITDNTGEFMLGKDANSTLINEQIADNGDDGTEFNSSWLPNGDGDEDSFGVNSNLGAHSGLRFQTVNVPQGATIISAYLYLYGTNTVGTVTNVHGKIVGNDVDSAAAWGSSDRPSQITGVSATTATVDWDPTSWPTSSWNSSPDIGTIVAEIVGRAGWVANNNMRFAIQNDSSVGPTNAVVFREYNNSPANSAKLAISYGSPDKYYDGVIDEVKVYPVYVSSDQVKVEYNQGKAAIWGSTGTEASSGVPATSADRTYCPPESAATCLPPIAHYTMDEKNGTATLKDSTANNNSGTMTGFTESAWTNGPVGNALTFNGSSSDIDIDPINNNIAGTEGTVTVWLKRTFADTVGAEQRIIEMYADSSNYTNFFYNAGSDLFNLRYEAGGEEDNVFLNPSDIPQNTWMHVAWTWSDTANNFITYLNGRSVGTSTGGVGTWVGALTGSCIGSRSDCLADNAAVVLDDIKIYNYARSPAEIMWDYNKGKPVAWYKFDEASWTANCSTNTVFDSSGNLHHGVSCPNTTGATTPEAGKRSTALHFDDQDDYVSVADSSYLDLTGGVSITAWVQTDANEAENVILAKGTSYEVGINADGDVYWDGTGSAVDDNKAKVGATVWHHVVVVGNDTTVTFYVDGEKTGIVYAAIDADNNTALTIGYDGTNYFDGLLDDVQIYSYPLTAEQARLIYNQGAVSFR